ncbi:PLP-dependent transferase [Artomyces pyxidatus]|uniref:PLP-dependent transferase n=1 Tax=Artomyces pyxidatus TaxID=48021 RepID=A0ACB8T3I1_9AGAM|nr:PLP-dependent transferase [Artomyces pyxidatus]
MSSALHFALERAMAFRLKKGMPSTDLSEPIPSSAPDLFSNDYLSMASNPQLRRDFLEKLMDSPSLFGSRGSRLLAGNTPEHMALENRLQQYFQTPAALLFNSGYDANVAFFGSVPQEGDAIIFDELVHASCRDGMAASRARKALHPFAHNSVASFERTLKQVLAECPQITARKATLFVSVESLYSMDGDFCPLPEMLRLLDQYVPRGCYHVAVDEAHSTGIFGPGGRGFVAELGLQNRVHTVIHTFGKARGLTGAVIATSAVVRRYLIQYARPLIFSTSLPHINLIALEASFDIVEGPLGDQLRERLHDLSAYFRKLLVELTETVPKSLISLPGSHITPDPLISTTPIFPILTSQPIALATFFQKHGYSAQPIPYPAVPRGQERIRVVVHSGNSEQQLCDFVTLLRQWASSPEIASLGANHGPVSVPERLKREDSIVEEKPVSSVASTGQRLASVWFSWITSFLWVPVKRY